MSSPKRWSWLDWLIILIFAGLVVLFYWRILTPNLADRQSFPPGDFVAQFWAFTTFEVRELSAGRLPLWNPYTFAGAPFWADVQSAVLYPPSLLTLLLSGPWGFSLFALEIEAIVHFWLAAVFMYLFSRRITGSRAAAFIAGLTFTFSGYLTGYPSQQLAVLEADVWLPLILFFIHRASQRVSESARERESEGARERISERANQRGSESARERESESGSRKSGEAAERVVGNVEINHHHPDRVGSEGSLAPARLWSSASRLRRSPVPNLLLAGVAWGMTLLAGHPQSALIVAYVSGAYLLFLWLTGPSVLPSVSRAARFGRGLLYTILFLGTGLALAAVQFLPAVEYTLLSVRAEGNYNTMAGGLPITDAIQLLLPGQVSLYSPLYVGVVGLLLALWATFRDRHTIFWAIVALIAFLITFGGNTFFYSPLYLFSPGFSIFRGQERWAFAVAFSLSVLAGYGFQQVILSREERSNTPDPELSTTILPTRQAGLSRLTQYLFLLALLLTFLFFYGLNDTGWTPASPFYGLLGQATLLTILLALAWLLWRFASRLPLSLLTIFTATLICFDLFTINWQTNLYPQLPEWHTQIPESVAAIKQNQPVTSPGEPFRVYNEFRLYDNYGVPFALEDLWGASPLRPDRYDKFLAPPMPIERTWELLNVKYVVTWREELYVPSTIIYQEPADDGTTYVHRLHQSGPRAWLVTQAEITDDATILHKIADPAFDRWRVALLEPGAEPYVADLNQDSVTAAPEEPAPLLVPDITFPSPQSLSIPVTSPAPALLMLSETYYPGWQATVDGQPVPILRADYVLRAVPIPTGEHLVELTFRPLSLFIGAIISGVTATVILISLILVYTKRKSAVNLPMQNQSQKPVNGIR